MDITGTGRSGPSQPAPAPSIDGRTAARRGWSSGRSRATVASALALGLAAGGLAAVPAQAIDSNPPTGPGNIEIFAKRDMVGLFDYTEYSGKTAEIKVLRDGAVIGSARGVIDGTGFLEVNHAGALCWGDGTDLKVTPDIKGGDEVRVDFLGTGTPSKWDGAMTQDVEVTDVTSNDQTHALTIEGSFGPGVDMPGTDLTTDPGKFAVEIVNPDMRGGTSAVGERAIGWPVEVGEVTTGYTVTGTVNGTDAAGGAFAVTYDFETATDLDLAKAGEHIAMAWQADHPDPNQEAMFGLTAYEDGEAPGPAMGGCPAGPTELRPVAPTEYSAKGAGDGKISVTWGAGSSVPASPEVEGYEVTAIRSVGTGLDTGGVVRTGVDGRSAEVEGLDGGEVYDVELTARSDAGDSKPVIVRARAANHVRPDATTSTLAAANDAGKYPPLVDGPRGDFRVHLDPVAGVLGAEIHYTVDGSTPDLGSPTFVSGVSDPLDIRQDTTVKWIVIDAGNVIGSVGSQFFDIVEAGQAAPEITAVAAAPVSGAVDVTFSRLTDPTVGAYRVQTYDEAGTVRVGTPVGIAQPADGDTVVRRVPNLTNGTKHTFTVAARYGSVWSAESELSDPVAPEAGSAANAGPDQDVQRGRTFTLDGSASPKATSFTWTQIRPGPAANGSFPQDPQLDLNPNQAGVQSTTGASSTPTLQLRAPLLTTPTSDHTLQFRLNTVHSDGVSRMDLVDVKLRADTVTADDIRWRAGDEIGGTGSQENAQLTLLNGGPTGQFISTVSVINGEWQFAGGAPALTNGIVYVWSDYGFTASIRTTN